MRQEIFLAQLRQEEKSQGKSFGEFELDESYFGAKRVRDKKGRKAAGKTQFLDF